LPDPNLIETIALAHDIGHPPFGHGGEVALNYALRDAGGFEGNGQTLRLLSCLEAYQEGFGLDLTRRSLLGVLKYPAQYEAVCRIVLPRGLTQLAQLRRDDWKPPKCYMRTEAGLVAWILEPFTESDKRRFIELDFDPSEEKHGKTKHRSFDTTIMELSDDIAYGVHDLEDAISLKMISKEDWIAAESNLDRDWASSLQLVDDRTLTEKLFPGLVPSASEQ
jgi:dGTPase